MHSKQHRLILFTAILALLAFTSAFVVPSGAILSEAAARYQDESDSDWAGANAWDYHVHSGTVRYLASAGLSDVIMPTYNIAYLPLDREEPGRIPIEENFTATGYSDETIIVEMEEVRTHDSTFHIAYVKIATPTQLRTATAGSLGSSRTLKPTVFSQSMNAIVLINGDYYTKTVNGYIYRQGEAYRQKFSNNIDLLLIDENADFHILMHGKSNQKTEMDAFLKEHEIINGFFFGPALVVDGEMPEISKHYDFNPYGNEPRAAIGQLAPLTYVLVTVDGRIENSEGVTMPELAAFMYDLGCTQAYALDGGNSSALVFHHNLVSVKNVHERDVSDVIYFATAIDN
jgi:exopolysaccharide biosynthesis protein